MVRMYLIHPMSRLLFIGLFVFCLGPSHLMAGPVDSGERIHYVEAAKPIEPLAPQKAIELATLFFAGKYPNDPKNYFARKSEYERWGSDPHPYSWEISFSPKPGHGFTIDSILSVILLVAPNGKVTIEKESYDSL
jgi:hypothetical protein